MSACSFNSDGPETHATKADERAIQDELDREFSAMPNPCDIEESAELDAVASELTAYWQSQGVDTNIMAIYVPKILPNQDCQVNVDGEVATVGGSQDIAGSPGVVVSPRKDGSSASELTMMLRHEAGHQVQEVQGLELPSIEAEATADCYAGMSSKGVEPAELLEYRASLQNAGDTGPFASHSTGQQRDAYFMNGYNQGSCALSALRKIRSAA